MRALYNRQDGRHHDAANNFPEPFLVLFDRHTTIERMRLRLPVTLFLLVLAASSQAAIDPNVSEIQKKFDTFLPPDEQLRVYQLDWSPNFREAKSRAAKEQRPILFLVVLNSYGNLFTGHC